MFPYRGLIILIALCAFGAIQASFEADGFEYFKHHRHHNSSNSSTSGNHSHPHHPGHNNSSHPGVNHTHPGHHPGHNNGSHPGHHPGHNNSSHPHHPGQNNSTHPGGNHTHPHHPPGNHSNPHHPGNSNSSHWQVPQEEIAEYASRLHKGFRLIPIRALHLHPQENRPVMPIDADSNLDEAPEARGLFNRRPLNYPRPIFRPHVNGSWYRPANNSWSLWG